MRKVTDSRTVSLHPHTDTEANSRALESNVLHTVSDMKAHPVPIQIYKTLCFATCYCLLLKHNIKESYTVIMQAVSFSALKQEA